MTKAKGLKNDSIEKKPDLSLLPLDLLGLVAKPYEYGLEKYQRNSHRGGFETHRNIAAALRHISDWNDRGQEYDGDAWQIANTKVHHISMAIFNLLCVLDAVTYNQNLVDNFIPADFQSEVPIDDEPELKDRIECLREYWIKLRGGKDD